MCLHSQVTSIPNNTLQRRVFTCPCKQIYGNLALFAEHCQSIMQQDDIMLVLHLKWVINTRDVFLLSLFTVRLSLQTQWEAPFELLCTEHTHTDTHTVATSHTHAGYQFPAVIFLRVSFCLCYVHISGPGAGGRSPEEWVLVTGQHRSSSENQGKYFCLGHKNTLA